MKLLVVVATTLIVLAQGRPQYNYPAPSPPSGSYGVPGGGIGVNGIGIGGGNFGGGGGHGGGIGFGGGGISGGGISGGGISGGDISGGGISGGGISGGGISGGISGGGISGGADFGGGGGAIGGGAGGGILVQKHIYVHVAPQEPEEVRQQKPISAGQATKHYKIIFIKAPSFPAPTAPTIPLQAQNEEKTLVYVLVKRPDEAADITIPTAAPTQPSKPEVYFIRYKTKTEATGGGAVGGRGIGGGAVGGGVITGGEISGGTISSGGSGAGGIGISTGSSSTSVVGGGGRLSTQYGPPGQSGPY